MCIIMTTLYQPCNSPYVCGLIQCGLIRVRVCVCLCICVCTYVCGLIQCMYVCIYICVCVLCVCLYIYYYYYACVWVNPYNPNHLTIVENVPLALERRGNPQDSFSKAGIDRGRRVLLQRVGHFFHA